MAEPSAETTKSRFNPESFAPFALRLGVGLSEAIVTHKFQEPASPGEEGYSASFDSFYGSAGLEYLIPISPIASSYWLLGVGGDLVGETGDRTFYGFGLSPSVTHRWDGGDYEWRLEGNYIGGRLEGSNEFSFSQDPSSRAFALTPDFVHQIGASTSFGFLPSDQVVFGFGIGVYTATGFQAQNINDPNDRLDFGSSLAYRLGPFLRVHPFGSAKSYLVTPMEIGQALNELRVLQDQWRSREIQYEPMAEKDVTTVKKLLDHIYAIAIAGKIPVASVKVQIVGHASDTGAIFEDASKANAAARRFHADLSDRIRDEPYARHNVLLASPTHYGSSRLNRDVLQIVIHLPGEETVSGPELNGLQKKEIEEKSKLAVEKIRALAGEIELIRIEFENETEWQLSGNKASASFDQAYQKIVQSCLDLFDLIDKIPDPELKQRLDRDMRIQLTGHSQNPAFEDPPPGKNERDYYLATNRKPQFFLDVALQRANAVKTRLLEAMDADRSGFLSQRLGGGEKLSLARQRLQRLFQAETAAPLTSAHTVTIRESRIVYGYGYGGVPGGMPIQGNPFVERQIQITIEGNFFETTNRQETDNGNHVRFRPIFSLEPGKPAPFFKTPDLTDKTHYRNPVSAPRGPNRPPAPPRSAPPPQSSGSTLPGVR